MTRIGIFGDVHGNLPALEAVLAHAGECDAWWCVGDIVGYGPDPNECTEKCRQMCDAVVVGNHDLASIGELDLSAFNPLARAACEWTGSVLEEKNVLYLGGLPKHERPANEVLLVHGSPLDPVWEYVLSKRAALLGFDSFTETLCFHGHSHAPAVFEYRDTVEHGPGRLELTVPLDGTSVRLENGSRYMLNVGSIGQPRDGDPRSCYVTYDPVSGVVEYHRVEYPVARVQEKMMEVGLPVFLVERLASGR